MIITIDGPIATGKSSIAKKLAEELGFIYFDTGAMYRCIAYGILTQEIRYEDPHHLHYFLKDFEFEIKMHRGEKRYFIEEEDVSEKIRGAEVTELVSQIAALQAVRDKLVALQRSLSVGVNAIFEGRDMGTVVFPDADLKIFLTGETVTRAKRRHQELKQRFPKETEDLTLERTIKDITARDLYDTTRPISPLMKARDALVVDTTNLSIEEIVFKILEYKNSLPHK
jgi:cytidylate kinase